MGIQLDLEIKITEKGNGIRGERYDDDGTIIRGENMLMSP